MPYEVFAPSGGSLISNILSGRSRRRLLSSAPPGLDLAGKKCVWRQVPFIAIFAIVFFGAFAPCVDDPLAQGFKNPPDSAKPRTWWHWTGSNVSKEGITKDLEWMKRIGLGGMQMFDVGTGGGQPVEQKTVFMTPEWLDALKHAASEADRLGLEMAMAASGGWSETGGPWVKPEQAMKKVVWSEMTVEGPKDFLGKLPQPPYVNGQIRDLPLRGIGEPEQQPQSADPTYYEDTRVLAFPTPKDSVRMENLNPLVTSNIGVIEASALVDDSLTTSVSLSIPDNGKPAWIQYQFNQPFKARAASFAVSPSGNFGSSIPMGAIEASDDGKTFRTLARLPGEEHNIRPINVRTFAFPETSARFYRLQLTHPSLGMRGFGAAGPGFGTIVPQKQYTILEFKFYSDGRVNRWEDKASFAPLFEFDTLATPAQPASAVIERGREIDLSSMMSKDGTLKWRVPAGKWTILRMGCSLTGAKNNPATPASQGFEVDKLNPRHVEAYFHGYTDRISQTLGPLFGKSLRYLLMDSWEANSQNWTNDMIAEFQKRRGYDPTPYLPVLSGRVVESAEVSDRFLWDYRRTVADMLAENHYGKMSELLHQRGMGLYAEAVGISLPILEDTLLVKKYVDIPMGEFGLRGSGGSEWVPPVPAVPYLGQDNRQNDYWADIRGAASAAHIYGKTIIGAESFTGGGYEAPGLLKWVADYWTSQGVNRFIFHTSAHQPLDTKPGNTMVGTHFNRNITWAELALPFTTYLARSMYMAQQGIFVADVAYYLGEGIPSSPPYWEKIKPEAPEGYDYDFLNTDVLLNGLSVKDGRLVLPSGMSYSILVLPESREMTLPVLRKLRELVAAGATMVGPKPLKSPSLAGYPRVDKEVAGPAAGRCSGRAGSAAGFRVYQA
ncbi:MAG: glycoside hydrolase family 2 sugar binding [Acidobacteria bacterium]|nr:glycoside hydrolase family 2 sugar binding [Acidobacteriota bacterium]